MSAPYPARFVAFALISAAGVLAACGRDEPNVVVQKDGTTIYRTSEDGAEVQTAKDGESLDVTGELPAFAPVYPGSTVKTRVADVNGQGAKGGMWVLETTDPVEKVAAFYDEQAKKAGVKPGMFVNEKDSAVRIFGDGGTKSGKSEGALIAISYDEEDKLTKIVITSGAAVSQRADSAATADASSPRTGSLPRLQ